MKTNILYGLLFSVIFAAGCQGSADNTGSYSDTAAVRGELVAQLTHAPGVPPAAIRSTVQWILRNGARQDRTFYNGISGLLRFPASQPGTYSLIASYTDHGAKDQPGQRLKGTDRVTLTVR